MALLAAAVPACKSPAAGQGEVAELPIKTRAVSIADASLTGLKLRGTVELFAEHSEFGGFSGLLIENGRLTAVSDAGWLLKAELRDGADGVSLHKASFRQLLDSEGRRLRKRGGDAEALARVGRQLWIAFERDHRLEHYPDQRPRAEIRNRSFEALRSNSGLEALATLPDSRMLAIAEGGDADGFPVFLVSRSGAVKRASLPRIGNHAVTGADVGPDGRLYVVLRSYFPLLGVSIRVHSYRLTPDGLPDAATHKVLAAFESASGIDNMEGIAVWTDARGRTRLTLIADNNFNSIQRNLLMDFEFVTEK